MNKAEQLSIVCAIIYAHNPESGINAAMIDAKDIVRRSELEIRESIRRADRDMAKAVGEHYGYK